MKTKKPLVAVVDDDDGVRLAVRQLLAGAGMEVRDYAGCRKFLEDTGAHDCDCLVLDVRLADGNGLSLHRQLAARGEPPPVIFMSAFGDIPLVVQAMRAGALAFLEKPFGAQALLEYVHEAIAHAGRRRRTRDNRKAIETRLATLTPREREVLALVAKGVANKDAAGRLDISIRTVEHHRAAVMRKMQTSSLAELIQVLSRLEGR